MCCGLEPSTETDHGTLSKRTVGHARGTACSFAKKPKVPKKKKAACSFKSTAVAKKVPSTSAELARHSWHPIVAVLTLIVAVLAFVIHFYIPQLLADRKAFRSI